MEVLVPRSSSGDAVDALLAGLELREPSLEDSADEAITEACRDEDLEALSDQDAQQLQEPLAALEALQALAEQLAELLEPFRASRHAPSAALARTSHELVSQYCRLLRLAGKLQGETATLEVYCRMAPPLLEAAELLLEAGELVLLDSCAGIRANAGALHILRHLLDCFECHPLLEVSASMESLMCRLVTRGHALRSLVTLLVAAYPEGHDREEGCSLAAAVYGMFCSLLAGDGEALGELEAMGLRHVALQDCATDCYAARVASSEQLAALDEEYGSWLAQQASSGTVLLPGGAGEAATKLIAMTGTLALLRCSEPLAALWERHLGGTDMGVPRSDTRWNKLLLKLALSVYLRRVQRFHQASRKGHAALPRYDLMPLAPASHSRLGFKPDRAQALYAGAEAVMEAAIAASDEQPPGGPLAASGGASLSGGSVPIDIPSLDLAAAMSPGSHTASGSYTAGSGSFMGAPRGARTPRTPRTSAKALHHHHHHHHQSGGGGGMGACMASGKAKAGRKKR